MELIETARGFTALHHTGYPQAVDLRILQESSAIGDYDDSFDKPGSSFLWVDEHFHLNREQVAELIDHLSRWLKYGTLCKLESNKPTKRKKGKK